MCGLVGIAGDIRQKHLNMFRTMHLLDQIRGFDSSGVAIIGLKDKKAKVYKEVGAPNFLWKLNKDVFDSKGRIKSLPKAVIGHNRAATLGVVNKTNAHPFQFGHVTGAHNGTLRSWHKLEGHKEFDVDSMALFKTIEQRGIEETWKNFHGAAAITWWDDRNETLHMIRNRERPLFIAQIGDVLMWASEEWMLVSALTQEDMEFDQLQEYDNPHSLEVNHLYTFKVSGSGFELSNVKELEESKPVYSYSNVGYTRKYSEDYLYDWPFEDDGDKIINHSWAKTYQRFPRASTPKSVKFKILRSSIIHKGPDKINKYLLGKVLEPEEFKGKDIHIYPHKQETFQTYREKIYHHLYKDNVYEVKGRFRYLPLGKGDDFVIKVAEDKVNLIDGISFQKIIPLPSTKKNYIGYSNKECSKEEAEKNLKEVGSCCSVCQETLTVEDPYTFTFNNSSVYCKECADIIENYGWVQ